MLITLKNFVQYKPVFEENTPVGIINALHLKSEMDEDWYESQSAFAEDTLKVTYNAQGIIVSASYDVTTLVPINLSISEIEQNAVPEGFTSPRRDSMGKWMYQNGEIILTPVDPVIIATTRRGSEMKAAGKRIAALVELLEDGDITDEEQAELAALREYRSALRRIDIDNPEWPIRPVSLPSII